ncbi:MAG: hypothetical protein HYX94_03605 [Chloroflexi bacterium]|nr:hypothetical protein [Chloroflexota bacterium]
MRSAKPNGWGWGAVVSILAVAGFFGYRAALVTADAPPEPSPPAFVVPAGGPAPTALVDSSIAYQGRLVDSGGSPVNGTKTLTFRLYNASSGGSLISSSSQTVSVSDGVFNATIGVPQWIFDGTALWVEVQVAGDSSPMLPRQKIQPVPYALGLVPGAAMSTDRGWAGLSSYSFGGSQGGGIGLYGYSSTGQAGVFGYGSSANGVYGTSDTGDAIYGYAVGDGASAILGYSSNGYGVYGTGRHYDGVYGESDRASGVKGVSEAGYGVSGYSSTGSAGVYGSHYGTGYGVFGNSFSGSGVYGHSTTGFAGVFARNDGSGRGVYGQSTSGYGGYFYSDNYRGLYASSSPGYYSGYIVNRGGSSFPGLYVDGTLSASGGKSGYVVDLATNVGPEALETGDVVVIVGSDNPVIGEIPLVRVRRASEAESRAVAGVVDQPFAVDAATIGGTPPVPSAPAARRADGTSIPAGGHFSMVTLGSFRAINVDASYGEIQPGDLLVTSPHAGYAMKATSPAVGTVVGKALGSVISGTGQIPVIVTLQ